MYKNHIKPINKMHLGAGALKVEGPIVQKESIALEVTMASECQPPGTVTLKRVQWNT